MVDGNFGQRSGWFVVLWSWVLVLNGVMVMLWSGGCELVRAEGTRLWVL